MCDVRMVTEAQRGSAGSKNASIDWGCTRFVFPLGTVPGGPVAELGAVVAIESGAEKDANFVVSKVMCRPDSRERAR